MLASTPYLQSLSLSCHVIATIHTHTHTHTLQLSKFSHSTNIKM